jgi:hypothetical protein
VIPSLAEFLRSTYGAWRLARLDPAGMSFFEISIPAFWRSFGLAIVLAPAFVYMAVIAPPPGDAAITQNVSLAWAISVQVVAYAAVWAAFPIVMVFIARFLDLSATYVPFIIARNWSVTIQLAVLVPLNTVYALLPPESGVGILLLTGIAAIWFYQWFIARTALQTTTPTAIAIVVIDELIGLGINLGAAYLVYDVTTQSPAA